MGRFCKLSYALGHGQYPFVWVPKDRYRILSGPVGETVTRCCGAAAAVSGST